MKQRKPNRVILSPIVSQVVCHNKRCRKRLVGHYKIVDLENGYSAPICIGCYILLVKKGFEYNGQQYSAKLEKV